MFLLSKRFGALADRLGPHLFMGGGPIVAGLGLLLLVRTGGKSDYLGTVLPGVAVFGLGLAATVAPLTATVLGAVEPGHSGVASGINNAVARVAGLLAIAALGAVVAGSFQSRLDASVARRPLSPPARAAIVRARARPLVVDTSGVPPAEKPVVRRAEVDASVHAFRVGMGIGGGAGDARRSRVAGRDREPAAARSLCRLSGRSIGRGDAGSGAHAPRGAAGRRGDGGRGGHLSAMPAGR